jgi:DtxR family manganese transport transcriptional regulator
LTKDIHDQTRKAHATEVAEDYVEAIASAISQHGVCRAIDLVKQFAVTHATVNNTVARLQRDGLVSTQPYQPIELTPAGKRMATMARKRHEIVESFLRKLGVSEEVAALDSEGIEHHVSKETLNAMHDVLQHGWPRE